MSRDKHIEEMAKAVCINCMDEVCASGRCTFQWDCPLSMETINRLHRKGYRKASEVAREIFEEIERLTKNHGITYTQRVIAELKKKYTEGDE